MNWNNFFENIVPVGVIATLVTSLITIYYTRKNLKTTKYIDTITSERIKWIDTIRNDLSQFASWVTIYLNNIELLYDLKIDKINREKDLSYKISKGEEVGTPEEVELQEIINEISTIENELNSTLKSKIVEKIFLIKLRLNPHEDSELINLLDFFILEFSTFYHDEDKLKEINKKFNSFINLAQSVLKNEWEKVKQEVTGKY